MKRPMVYVAGPYTKGDVAVNVRNAIFAGDALLKAGAVPFIPHLTHFWHLQCPGEYVQWIDYDLAFLPLCDAVLRLPGESHGADGETDAASRIGIPVLDGMPSALQWVDEYIMNCGGAL